jgi:hypothetical protein
MARSRPARDAAVPRQVSLGGGANNWNRGCPKRLDLLPVAQALVIDIEGGTATPGCRLVLAARKPSIGCRDGIMERATVNLPLSEAILSSGRGGLISSALPAWLGV